MKNRSKRSPRIKVMFWGRTPTKGKIRVPQNEPDTGVSEYNTITWYTPTSTENFTHSFETQ